MCEFGSVSDGDEPGSIACMSDDLEPPVDRSAEEAMRPCDFCGHLVVVSSLDERDCPVCGMPDEADP